MFHYFSIHFLFKSYYKHIFAFKTQRRGKYVYREKNCIHVVMSVMLSLGRRLTIGSQNVVLLDCFTKSSTNISVESSIKTGLNRK